MNGWILDFARKHKAKITGRVLEVGSYNVNGSVRELLPITIGVDKREGPGVDRQVNASDLIAEFPEPFDCVVSCDALEHIEDWRAAMVNMWGVLKDGGILFLTMANPKKGVHGYPHDYWRFPLDDFCRLFGENAILDTFQGGPSLGAVVVKTHPLNLTIEPKRV